MILIFRIGGIEQQVGSPSQFYAVFFGEAVCPIRSVADLQVFGLLDGRRIGVVLDGEGLHTEPCAAFGQQGHRGLVDQVPVFDTSHTGFQGPGDPPRVVDMNHHIGAPILGSTDCRTELLLEEFGHIERIVERCGTAAGHQFDLRCALPEVLADGCRHGVGAVGDFRGADLFDVRHFAAATSVGVFIDHSEIAVSRGLGDHGSARIDARAPERPAVDGPFESEDGTSGVADGGESPLQGLRSLPSCHEVCIRGIACQQVRHRVAAQIGVPVRIDETGHQKSSLSVDHRDGPFRRRFDGSGRDRLDPIVPDQEVAGEGACVLSVENFDVVQ